MDFFEVHNSPYLYLLGWVFFPRLMFWFVSAITGGFWFWVGVFICPYLMAAFWATHYYWDTNPVICVFAWMAAFGGSGSETKVVIRRKK